MALTLFFTRPSSLRRNNLEKPPPGAGQDRDDQPPPPGPSVHWGQTPRRSHNAWPRLSQGSDSPFSEHFKNSNDFTIFHYQNWEKNVSSYFHIIIRFFFLLRHLVIWFHIFGLSSGSEKKKKMPCWFRFLFRWENCLKNMNFEFIE